MQDPKTVRLTVGTMESIMRALHNARGVYQELLDAGLDGKVSGFTRCVKDLEATFAALERDGYGM